MKELDKTNNSDENLNPVKGLQEVLSSNNSSLCSPFLGFNKNEEIEEFELDKLAELLTEIYFENKKYGN